MCIMSELELRLLQHLDDFTQLFRQLAGQSFAESVGEAAVIPQRLLLGLMKRAQIPLRHRVFLGPPSAGARDSRQSALASPFAVSAGQASTILGLPRMAPYIH